jgi:transaldolase
MNPLLELADHGQSYWLDDLTRDMLDDGALARRVAEEGLRGVTANPAIFHKAISGRDAYDADVRRAAHAGRTAKEIYEALAVSEVRRACDVLRPVYDASDNADGFVSLEVSPHLARNTAASVDEARRLWSAVDRPNLMIKIPGTIEGLPAIETLLVEGVNVNITLLFAVDRYEAVAEAYMRALERRLEAGRPIADVASVASFFLSRIDTLVDQLLAHRTTPDGDSAYEPHPKTLQGRIAIANAKVAYRILGKRLASDRWRALAAQGARPQRLLWASTSTKNPAYGDLMYVAPLIGPHTVNTMPERTIAAFADHGQARDSVERKRT